MKNLGLDGVWVVLAKELKDSLRDRRSLVTAMLPALLGPFAMLAILSAAADNQREEAVSEIAVIGQENAPDLIAYLERQEIEIRTFEGDPKTAIHDRDEPLVLSIPKDFGERFGASEPATVTLFSDESLERSQTASDRITSLIRSYASSIGSYRLMVRGVDPAVTSPIRLELRDFSTRTSRAATILGVLQMIMLVAPFSGGLAVAIDATAGERERNSLEPLLVHPMTSRAIAGGKWLAIAFYALLATLVAVSCTALALRVFSLEGIGVDPRLTGAMQIDVYLLLVPMALFASSIQMLASLFAKSFREAQTYASLITLLPMISIMATLFNEARAAPWMFAVPILGQQQLVTLVLRGEPLEMQPIVLATALTLALALLLFVAITRLLRSERVIYGG